MKTNHEICITSPVKIGDLLYSFYFDEVPKKWFVNKTPERVIEIGTKGFFLASWLNEPDNPDEFHPYDEIGKEFFLSYDEAKAAAEKMQEENNG